MKARRSNTFDEEKKERCRKFFTIFLHEPVSLAITDRFSTFSRSKGSLDLLFLSSLFNCRRFVASLVRFRFLFLPRIDYAWRKEKKIHFRRRSSIFFFTYFLFICLYTHSLPEHCEAPLFVRQKEYIFLRF